MSLLDNLAHLLQGHHQAQPQPEQAIQAISHAGVGVPQMFHAPQGGRQIPAPQMQGMPHQAEDDAQVFGPHGVQPLNQLNSGPWGPGEPFMPLGGRPNTLRVMPPYARRGGASFNGLQQSTSFDGGLQGYTEDDLSNGIQGGVVNQGYIPLQSGRPNPNRYY